MILDNKNNEQKVYEWLKEYTDTGEIDVVTGYFTVGALSYLSCQMNEKISSFRMILGDIVNIDIKQDKTIDLLNENITVEAALKLKSVAQEAVQFLKQEKVEAKTLEPNFCHAKLYLFNSKQDERHKYFISGSLNLTEAGIGLKRTNNIELNIAETGDNNQYQELVTWFNTLWKSKEAHKNKITDKKEILFKEYLIEAIEKIFIEYTPRQIYYKVLFELFGNQTFFEQDDPEFNRQVDKLEKTEIYNALYDFQKKGVLSLIKMLQKHNGAILADAVGLGKTWSALAVMKFFQLQGREIILICPKKLQYNWRRYTKHQNSKFEKDQLEYFMRYHTDMHRKRMDQYNDRADKFFVDEKPKLFVIDESHNLRNAKTKRYKFLVEEILKKNFDVKVLMLSATPINNTLIDIRNQFKLIKQGNIDGFFESHSIRNIDHLFSTAQKKFFEWREAENLKINDFIKSLPSNFFKLTDSLTVARTRAMIEKQDEKLFFPKKNKPENIFVTPKKIGKYNNFEELFDNFPPFLSGYQPTFYIEQADDVEKIHDEKQRDRFLVQMMYILLVKRLESSWFSFKSTVGKILAHHQNALDKVDKYEKAQSDTKTLVEQFSFSDDEQEELIDEDEFFLGKKRQIKLVEIDKAGKIKDFKTDLKKDIEALDTLRNSLNGFGDEITEEVKTLKNHSSKDEKLQSLIKKILKKRIAGENENNQKVLIFTVYKDTAFYLFNQLTQRGFKRIAVISGDAYRTDTSKHETKKFEPILERFAPFTKLFNEKKWSFVPSKPNLSKKEQYVEWVEWVKKNDLTTFELLENPIDILIATDVLSEGQNLQDCDMVINYDIHWNPVRIIQRMGRIDRLGSFNQEIFGVNYWPSENINKYLNLKVRIEQKMALMKIAGSETTLEFSETFKEMAKDKDFENKMNEKMLKQMETSWSDIEEHDSGLGFDNLSLEEYRQDLWEEFKEKEKFYKGMPKGVYTGFKANRSICEKDGIIALLGYPSKPPKTIEYKYKTYDLIYIDKQGKAVLLNQKEILEALSEHKNQERVVSDKVDKGEQSSITELVTAFKNWIASQKTEEEILEDGTVKERAGPKTRDILDKLKIGDNEAIQQVKDNISVSDKYQLQNFDLVAWFLVS